jgi:hypothetical protein
VRDYIKKLLNEIKFSQERANELKDKFGWRFVQTQKPKSGELYNKLHIYTFRSPKYKYNVYIEEYDYEFYLISFTPKLNKDFFVKQSILQQKGRKFFDAYSYQTKEQIPLQIFSLMVSEINKILKTKQFASFGYLGAPDVKTGDDDFDMFNTKRVRIYNQLLNDEFGNTHKIISDIRFSGSLVLNRDVLEEYPMLEKYCFDILESHL